MHQLFDQRRYLIPFRSRLLPQIFTDVLVIGQGVAGQSAAIEAAKNHDVILVAKGKLHDANTFGAQGGIAAVLAQDDHFQSHIDDTLAAGGGLCDQKIVKQVVQAAPLHIDKLIQWGMPFDRADPPTHKKQALALGREGGHAARRIVHCDGDATGKALGLTLDKQLRRMENIRLFEQCFVLDLMTTQEAGDPEARCLGVITHHPKYGLQVIWAQATILASGGAGQVYRESTNPSAATGDGLAMAYRAGAALADLAFMQFHPTTLYIAGASRALITEAVRGEGAHLVDRDGQRFMPNYHPQAELAPRDIVSRSIIEHMASKGHTHVFLDCSPIGPKRFVKRFPGITRLLKNFDIEPGVDQIPIHPSAHYMIGGIVTDAGARTNIKGFYACGEAACTGLHGANRLASNSLLEGLVFGQIAGQTCSEMLDASLPGNKAAGQHKVVADIRPSNQSELDIADVQSSLRAVMWRDVGIQRSGPRLAEVMQMFDFWARYTLDKIFDDLRGWQVQNMIVVGALITRSAHWRQESRGTHYRTDHTLPKDDFATHDVWIRDQLVCQPKLGGLAPPAPRTPP